MSYEEICVCLIVLVKTRNEVLACLFHTSVYFVFR